jgi:hypothetical protein
VPREFPRPSRPSTSSPFPLLGLPHVVVHGRAKQSTTECCKPPPSSLSSRLSNGSPSCSSTPTSPLRYPVLRSHAPAQHFAGIEPQQGRRPPLLSSTILRTTSTPPDPKNRTLGEPMSLPTTSPVHPGGELAGFWTSPPVGVPRDYIAELPGCLGCFLSRRVYL